MASIYLILLFGLLTQSCLSAEDSGGSERNKPENGNYEGSERNQPENETSSSTAATLPPASTYSTTAETSPEPSKPSEPKPNPGKDSSEESTEVNPNDYPVNRRPHAKSEDTGYAEEKPERYRISNKESTEESTESSGEISSEYKGDRYGEEDQHRHYCPPCLVWKRCGFPCQQECHPNTERCRCQPGCFCPGNLKLNHDGQCVSSQLCPKKPHKACCYGKMYTSCGSTCVQSCGVESCSKECKEGCFCLRGTKLIDGICQPPYKCRTCAGGRVYQKCGRRCNEICGCHHDDYPPDYCEEGCFCPTGHRIVGGVCRPDHECPPEHYHYYYYYRK